MTLQVNITANGRMSLPAGIRKRLGLESGGAVLLEETADGVVLRTVPQAVARAGDRQKIRRPSRRIGRRLSHQPPSGQRRVTEAVLDASAVIALLKGERGGSKVAGVVADAAAGQRVTGYTASTRSVANTISSIG